MKRERPILFSAPMVRAVLSGAKTQTRRLVSRHRVEGPDQRGICDWYSADKWVGAHGGRDLSSGGPLRFARSSAAALCPYGVPGDRLWVRETWAHDATSLEQLRTELDDAYGSAHGPYYRTDPEHENSGLRWRPSIHMPRWASRITLDVTEVRVQRLQEISEDDARAEGMDWAAPLVLPGERIDDDREDPREVGYGAGSFALQNFRKLWDSINGKRAPWATNPWVWAISFQRVEEKSNAA